MKLLTMLVKKLNRYFNPLTYLHFLSPTTFFYPCIVVVFSSDFSSLFSVNLGHLPKVWTSAVSDKVIVRFTLLSWCGRWLTFVKSTRTEMC